MSAKTEQSNFLFLNRYTGHLCDDLSLHVYGIDNFFGVGQPISIEPFKSFQRYWYFEGARNNWAFVDGCSKPDPELLYTANEGTCTFYNTEFHTAITQTERAQNPSCTKNMNSSSLVVLGDSMAFGWGRRR